MHLLTVSDIPGFARQWGIVEFKMVGNKVRFEINHNAARKDGLKISSRLLRVADVVSQIPSTTETSRISRALNFHNIRGRGLRVSQDW